MGPGSLKILLGIGLGIIAVSGLVVTVLFSKYANSFSAIDKLKMKIPYDNNYHSSYFNWVSKDLYSASIAIAVLGCISFAVAIIAIILSLLMDGQTMILIIVGAVSALFTFGCIIAEGIFMQKCINVHANYSNKDDNHEDSYEYISKAFEEFYTTASNLYQNEGLNINDYMSWDDIKKKLGKEYEETGEIFTFKKLWLSYQYSDNSCSPNKYFQFYIKEEYNSNKFIYATVYYQNDYGGMCKSIKVASLNFKFEDSYVPKQRVCWPNNIDKVTDYKCKNIKLPKMNFNKSHSIDQLSLTTNVVVGEYVSIDNEKLKANYHIENFPVTYHLLTKEDLKKKDDELVFDDGGNNFYKITGKEFAEAFAKEDKKALTKPDKTDPFIITPSSPKDYKDAISLCESFEKNENTGKIIKELGGICDFEEIEENENGNNLPKGTNFNQLATYLNYFYKDSNKGKVPPPVTKYYKSNTRSTLNQAADDISYFISLYTIAIINLIIQIFGIIFWACGRFLGFILGGSDNKTVSEGEA